MINKRRQSLNRYAVLAMIIGGAVLALSGLCTGLFIASGPDNYVPNALGVLGIGLIGIVPSAILFFASRHIFKNGPGVLPGVLVLLIGLPFLAIMLISMANLIQTILTQPYKPFGFMLFSALVTAVAVAITVFGIKTIRAARAKPDAANEF